MRKKSIHKTNVECNKSQQMSNEKKTALRLFNRDQCIYIMVYEVIPNITGQYHHLYIPKQPGALFYISLASSGCPSSPTVCAFVPRLNGANLPSHDDYLQAAVVGFWFLTRISTFMWCFFSDLESWDDMLEVADEGTYWAALSGATMFSSSKKRPKTKSFGPSARGTSFIKVNVSVELDKLRILFKNRTDKSEKVETPEVTSNIWPISFPQTLNSKPTLKGGRKWISHLQLWDSAPQNPMLFWNSWVFAAFFVACLHHITNKSLRLFVFLKIFNYKSLKHCLVGCV